MRERARLFSHDHSPTLSADVHTTSILAQPTAAQPFAIAAVNKKITGGPGRRFAEGKILSGCITPWGRFGQRSSAGRTPVAAH
jgi:hypothetical protein